jgi:hypothetical protein
MCETSGGTSLPPTWAAVAASVSVLAPQADTKRPQTSTLELANFEKTFIETSTCSNLTPRR